MTIESKIQAILESDFPTAMVSSEHVAFVNRFQPAWSAGSLDEEDIIGILASRVAQVNQEFDQYTVDLGIGVMGLNIQQLVRQGLVKQDVLENLEELAGDNTGNIATATEAAPCVVTFRGPAPSSNGEKIVISNASPSAYDGIYYVSDAGQDPGNWALYTDASLTTPLDSTAFGTFVSAEVTFNTYTDSPSGLGITAYLSGLNSSLVYQALQNHTSWTGTAGINNLDDLLSDIDAQVQIYIGLLSNNIRILTTNDIVSPSTDTVEVITAVLSVYTGLSPRAAEQLTKNDLVPDSVVSTYVSNSLQGMNYVVDGSATSILDDSVQVAIRSILVGSGELLNPDEQLILDATTGGAASYDRVPRAYPADQYLAAVEAAGTSFAEDIAGLVNFALTAAASAQALAAIGQSLGSIFNNVVSPAGYNAAVAEFAGLFGVSNIKKSVSGYVPSQGTLQRYSLDNQVRRILLDPRDPNSYKIQVPRFAIPSLKDIERRVLARIAEIPNPVTIGLEAFNSATGAAFGSIDQAVQAYNQSVLGARTELTALIGEETGDAGVRAANRVFDGETEWSISDYQRLRLGITQVATLGSAIGVNLITIEESRARGSTNAG